MSDVFSKIWLTHTQEPARPRFRLSARLPLESTDKQKALTLLWLDEVSMELVEHGPYQRVDVARS